MGFLISLSQGQDRCGRFNTALSVHSLWSNIGDHVLLDVADTNGRRLRIAVTDENSCAHSLWKNQEANDSAHSFIYILGWCYRIGFESPRLTQRDYEKMFDRYRQGLPPVGEEFSGNYVVVIYDNKYGRIAIQPDRWAMSSIYFSEEKNSIAVSNRSVSVAALVGAALDGHSIFSLIRGTHLPFGRSLFAGVHRVLCGCYLDIDIKASRIDMRRALPLYVPTQKRTFKEAVEIVSEAMRGMGRRLTRCESAMFDLTGGNDTRLTAAAVSCDNPDGLRTNFVWRVAGPDDHPDVRIAQTIAQLCGWRLVKLAKFSVTDAPVEALKKAVVRADGTCLFEQAFGRIRQENALQGDWQWLVGSIGGELLRGFFWRHEMVSLGRSPKVDYGALLAYRLYAGRVLDSRAFGDDAPSLNEHDEVLMEPYRQIGNAGGDRLNPYKLDVMYLHKLCYSAGNSQSWLSGVRNIHYPLLSWDVTRLILSIPWKIRVTRSLQLRVIEGLDPKLARIPNDKGEPMQALGVATLPSYLKIGLLTGAKGFSRIMRRYMYPSSSSPAVNWTPPPASWIDIVKGASYLDSSYVKKVCSDVTTGSRTSDRVRTFYTLLTLELLLCEVPQLQKRIVFGSSRNVLQ